MKRIPAVAALIVLAFTIACTQAPPPEPPDTRAADESAIRAAVAEWAKAAEAKDAEKFLSFYAPNGSLMPPGMSTATGTTALREAVTGLMAMPGLDKLTFGTTAVEVARSGDLAYETGTYEETVTDPKTKKTTTAKGKYVCVWKKQADGSWKVLADIFNADPAAAPAP